MNLECFTKWQKTPKNLLTFLNGAYEAVNNHNSLLQNFFFFLCVVMMHQSTT